MVSLFLISYIVIIKNYQYVAKDIQNGQIKCCITCKTKETAFHSRGICHFPGPLSDQVLVSSGVHEPGPVRNSHVKFCKYRNWSPAQLIKLPEVNTKLDYQSPNFWSSVFSTSPQFWAHMGHQERVWRVSSALWLIGDRKKMRTHFLFLSTDVTSTV